MKLYDLYVFGSGGKVVVGWHKFSEANDEAAVKLALAVIPRQSADTSHVELWQDRALVKRWDEPW